MTSIIFYGDGQNSREKLEQWKRDGIEPACFTDADLSKQHTFFEGV